MSVGLMALLDDVAALAKVAATSIDDIAGQAARAGAKAAGVVIDDAAVTPRYVVGFDPARELPIIKRIAIGSLRNKLLILLPASLALSLFASWAITPLLMLGGAYLCFEGTEKIYEALVPHGPDAATAQAGPLSAGSQELEDAKVASAIKTDFILSAEIMAITLASLPDGSFWTQAAVLAVVGLGITVIVYGGVALIVKADDVGLYLAQTKSTSAFGAIKRTIGQGLVRGMPYFLTGLSVVGTAAMIWVGGGILIHGLDTYGWPQIDHGIKAIAQAASQSVPMMSGAIEWIVTAIASGLIGAVVGAAIIPLVKFIIAPVWNANQPDTVKPSRRAAS